MLNNSGYKIHRRILWVFGYHIALLLNKNRIKNQVFFRLQLVKSHPLEFVKDLKKHPVLLIINIYI